MLKDSELSESFAYNGLPALCVPPAGQPLHMFWYETSGEDRKWQLIADLVDRPSEHHPGSLFPSTAAVHSSNLFVLDVHGAGLARAARLVLDAPANISLLIDGPAGCGKTAMLSFLARESASQKGVSVRVPLTLRSSALELHEKCALPPRRNSLVALRM